MLRRLNVQTPLLGALLEHECPRCGREVELPLGEICHECRAAIEGRAGKISRLAAVTTALVLAVYVYARFPDDPTSRLVGLSSVIAWYVIIALVVKRVLREVLK